MSQQWGFSHLQSASRNLNGPIRNGQSVLPNHQHAALVIKCCDCRSSGVGDELPILLESRWKSRSLTVDVEEASREELFLFPKSDVRMDGLRLRHR